MNVPAVAHATKLARTFGSGPTAIVAVHDVDCSIHAGERIALMGPSGSGKTTLLHLLAGLDHPTTGTVDWPSIGTIRDLRPGPVAVVFQSQSLLPALNVVENVALPQLLAGINRHEANARACAALDHLGLEELAEKLPEEISGGQAQRVAIARALVGHPKLILADEPTGQLDHASGVAVIDALVGAAQHAGAALVVNTHDPAIAERLDIRWSMTNGTLTVSEQAPC